MIAPTPLRPGGTIGICAPAGPVVRERLQQAVRALEADGFNVELSPSAMAQHGLFSATDGVRRRELERMFSRRGVDAVFCARGGVGSSRLLPALNTQRIARSKKPLLGFSDVTALQWLLWKQEKFISFSGPLAVEWHTISARTRRQARAVLAGETANLHGDFPREPIHVLRKGRKVVGRLLPGNLTMIATLLGTPFLPSLKDAIVLVEDVNEPPHRVDRLFFHLRNAGALRSLGALLTGELGEDKDMDTVTRSVREATRGEGYPVAMNFPYGHGAERMTLPVGGLVEFDPSRMTLSLVEAVTRSAS
ncbi:MAG: LD-carboxypeptidase [bacterium]|nr:LD-carboxypeptidase [bacterium]